MLNGAKWDAKSVSDDFILSGYEGFSDVYMNRLRTQAGVNYDLSDRHSIEVYGIYDYLRDKDIKASEELSRLENRIFMDLSRKFIFGLSYKFTF